VENRERALSPPSLRTRRHPATAQVAARRGAAAPGVGSSPEPPQESDAGAKKRTTKR
jgi:hypothetical protein